MEPQEPPPLNPPLEGGSLGSSYAPDNLHNTLILLCNTL